MSTINRFKIGDCSCGCGGKDVAGRKVGKLFYCMDSYRSMKTKQYTQKASLNQRVRNLGKQDENKDLAKNYGALDRWFKDRRKEMTGKCHHCNGISCKHDDKYYKFSVCHILPKAYFPSIATHPSNFIELCFWNKNCHGNMDNKILDLIEMNCWDEIVTKFCIMYPSIAEKEKRRIPSILLEYLKVEL